MPPARGSWRRCSAAHHSGGAVHSAQVTEPALLQPDHVVDELCRVTGLVHDGVHEQRLHRESLLLCRIASAVRSYTPQ